MFAFGDGKLFFLNISSVNFLRAEIDLFLLNGTYILVRTVEAQGRIKL